MADQGGAEQDEEEDEEWFVRAKSQISFKWKANKLSQSWQPLMLS